MNRRGVAILLVLVVLVVAVTAAVEGVAAVVAVFASSTTVLVVGHTLTLCIRLAGIGGPAGEGGCAAPAIMGIVQIGARP